MESVGPYEALSRTLLESARRKYGKKAANGIARFFEGLGLPVPDKGEYCVTNDNSLFTQQDPNGFYLNPINRTGFLIPLNKEGCVIRISKRSINWTNHPHMIQPLFSYPAGRLRIDILPGIDCGVHIDNTKKVKSRLIRSFLWAGSIGHDIRTSNVGQLPNGHLLAIEPAALQPLIPFLGTIKKIFGWKTDMNAAHPQDEFFGQIKRMFADAWPNLSQRPDPSKMKACLKLCEKMTDEGTLKPYWTNLIVGKKYYVRDAAYRYHARTDPEDLKKRMDRQREEQRARRRSARDLLIRSR